MGQRTEIVLGYDEVDEWSVFEGTAHKAAFSETDGCMVWSFVDTLVVATAEPRLGASTIVVVTSGQDGKCEIIG